MFCGSDPRAANASYTHTIFPILLLPENGVRHFSKDIFLYIFLYVGILPCGILVGDVGAKGIEDQLSTLSQACHWLSKFYIFIRVISYESTLQTYQCAKL